MTIRHRSTRTPPQAPNSRDYRTTCTGSTRGRTGSLGWRLGGHPRARTEAPASRCGHPTPRAVSVIGDFNSWDRPSDPSAAVGRLRASGKAVVPSSAGPGQVYKFAITTHDGRGPAQGGPFRPLHGDATADRLGPVGPGLRVARRRLDGEPGRRAALEAPDLDLRGPPGQLAAGPLRTRPASSATTGVAEPADRARLALRLHPRRTSAGHGAPVLRIVGVPDHRLLRPDPAVRRPPGPDVADRSPARCGHRRDPRLGPIALPGRRLRASPSSTARTSSSTPIPASASTRTGRA